MGKRATVEVVFDEVRSIDIALLRRRGFLKSGWIVTGATIGWANGFGIKVDVNAVDKFVRLSYSSNGGERTDRVDLECRKSNIGLGLIWYFRCPKTGLRCRKLYEIGGRFVSRHADPSGMYRSQAEPKGDRALRRYLTLIGIGKDSKTEWDFGDRRHYRTYYGDKLTKRFKDYLERTEKIAELLDSDEWRRIFEGPRRGRSGSRVTDRNDD